MSKILKILSLITLIASVGGWVATGCSAGWTKTTVTEMQVDEFTGLEFPVEKDALVIGVDMLAIGIFTSAVLMGLSFIPKFNN